MHWDTMKRSPAYIGSASAHFGGHADQWRANRGLRGKRSGPPTFELRGSSPVGIPQTQTNRPQFGGMCEDEFARYPERARQFTNGHERIVFGIDHILQPHQALGV